MGDEPAAVAHLRDGTPVGAWLLKANPSVWDIGAALRDGTPLDWWRLAPSYRVELVRPGHPCVMWITRGDTRVPSGIWAAGEVTGPVHEAAGDPGDPLWRDRDAQRQVRSRVPVRLRVLGQPLLVEDLRAVPELAAMEILRVPRIGNPAAVTPAEWAVLLAAVSAS